ncbi:MAG: hypothetical protein WA148_06895 [Actinomycetota bacterium]
MSKKQVKESEKKNAKNRKWRRRIVGAFFIILAAYTILAMFQGGFQEYTEKLFGCMKKVELLR